MYHFKIILPSTPRYSKVVFSLTCAHGILYVSLKFVIRTAYSRPSLAPRFHLPNNIWRKAPSDLNSRFDLFRCKHYLVLQQCGRFQRPHGLRLRPAAALLLGLWVRTPPGTWTSVSCECCVLSGTGLYVGPIPRPGVS